MSLLDRLKGKRIVLAANIVDGYPSEFEYVSEFLLNNGISSLLTVSSPLDSRSRGRTIIEKYKNGKRVFRLVLPRPNFPPYTHVLDFGIALFPIRCDVWIGFNPLMSAVGSLRSRRRTLVNWAIDFVPRRGEIGIAERVYRWIEVSMMRRLSVQIENTHAARDARVSVTRLTPPLQIIAPIGVWSESFCSPQLDRHHQRRIVYFGSLDRRNGVPFLIEILELLLKDDHSLKVDIIGDGPEAEVVRGLQVRYPDQVMFHGYIKDQRDVDEILSCCVVAFAPYDESPGAFTAYADPQKLKYYASNGVPVLLTEVAPAARVMHASGGARILKTTDGAEFWAKAANQWLYNQSDWHAAAIAAYEYSLPFERIAIYTRTFDSIVQFLDSK
jgi:glycosyltransferase involved in cell wall biosynthesis